MIMDTNDNEKLSETNSSISSDLIRGHINTIILRTLYDSDKYGYEIINEIEEKSKGQYSLKQPTLYSALKRLESQDYITSYWGGASNGGRRKYFQITEKGKKIVEQNLAEWEYSRTVIDSLISEKDYDFNNPPPTSGVDFNLLKKSTTRVPLIKSDAQPEYDEDFFSEEDDTDSTQTDENLTNSIAAPIQEFEENRIENNDQSTKNIENELDDSFADIKVTINETNQQSVFESSSQTAHKDNIQENVTVDDTSPHTDEAIPLTEEEKQRIHENYKVLIGDNSDATSYYFSQVARKDKGTCINQEGNFNGSQSEEPVQFQQNNVFEDTTSSYAEQNYDQNYEQDYATQQFVQENDSSADLLYSNKPPAERNYKSLLSKLYENTQRSQDETISAEYQEKTHNQSTEPIKRVKSETPKQTVYPLGNTASNVEFYDLEEKAENDGLRISTSNGSKNRTVIKSTTNTFDKGRVLFVSALVVFVIAIIESIINISLKSSLKTSDAYVILPFVIDFVMLGVFLFLYLRGYGKNSRKSQARSYISASLILYANLVLIVCVIAYLLIWFDSAELTFIQILKYAIFPCIYLFNIPLFALLYNYNSNKQ